jgi:hypothetical protein
MCLIETYRFRVGEHSFVLFRIEVGYKKGDILKPLLLNFALKYDIRIIQLNLDSFKLKGTNQLLVYADHVNLLGGSLYTV